MQVSACPGGVTTGYTYFIPSEEHLESRVTTRGFMEARMTVALAGRCELSYNLRLQQNLDKLGFLL